MTRVARTLDDVTREPSVVTIGFFDGVHRGHQAIIADAVDAAGVDQRSVVVTFDRHPMEVLRPGSHPRYLMNLERRVGTLLALDVDLVVVLGFTLELSRLSPQDFAGGILAETVGATRVVVGENFRFGHRAAGDVARLRELGRRIGFDVTPVGLLGFDGGTVSSTGIRELLDAGDVDGARRALGRPHVVDGTVVRGEGRGRTIGVPTANIEVDARLQLPAPGVYAGTVVVDPDPGRSDAHHRPAVMNIGTRPTFGGQQPTLEAHLLDAEVDLYGRHVAAWFEHRLREERRFDGPDDLVAQIRRDIEQARRLFAS